MQNNIQIKVVLVMRNDALIKGLTIILTSYKLLLRSRARLLNLGRDNRRGGRKAHSSPQDFGVNIDPRSIHVDYTLYIKRGTNIIK